MISKRNIGWLPVILLLLVTTAAYAEPKIDAVDQPLMVDSQTVADNSLPGFSEMVLPSMTRIGFSLLLIIGIIYAVVFLMKKFTGKRFGASGRAKNIQLIEQTYLAPKKSVCLLKLGERAVVVGITETNVNLLTEFGWDELPEIERNNPADPGKRFSGFLNDAVGRIFKSDKGEGVGHEQN